MTRNQKIAIGCGAGGCLGLIFLLAVCGVLFFVFRSSSMNGNRTSTFNSNRRYPSSDSNSNSNANSDSTDSEETSSSTASDDDKHKLFQAAGATQDSELMQRVLKKLGFVHADGSPTDEYEEFLKTHLGWAIKNVEFIKSVSTPEKARAYVEAHIND
jgi:hypothetical protein